VRSRGGSVINILYGIHLLYNTFSSRGFCKRRLMNYQCYTSETMHLGGDGLTTWLTFNKFHWFPISIYLFTLITVFSCWETSITIPKGVRLSNFLRYLHDGVACMTTFIYKHLLSSETLPVYQGAKQRFICLSTHNRISFTVLSVSLVSHYVRSESVPNP
jgi:hypothetical protein